MLTHAADAFAGIDLGDARRTRRLLRSVEAIQSQPDRSFPRSLATSASLEGFYRLVNHEAFRHDVAVDHLTKDALTRADAQIGRVLVLHDTTEYAFPGEELRPGLTQRGSRQAFWGHHALAVADAEVPAVHGVVGMHPYVQEEGSWWRVLGDDREVALDRGSDRWLDLVLEVEDAAPAGLDIVHVMDREGDAFLLLAEMAAQDISFVVRSAHDRKVSPDNERLADVVVQEPLVARREVPLTRRRGSKAPKSKAQHPPRDQRTATLAVRFGTVELQAPRDSRLAGSGSVSLFVVEVVEENPPADQPPVHWRLLTNLPVSSAEEALQIVDVYRRRWLIEEFFKAIKTGCAYPKRQANTRASLIDTLAVLLPVAVSLLNLRAIARSQPKASWSTVLDELEFLVLQQAAPAAKLTRRANVRKVMLAVASLGGHQKSNGEPGWQTLGGGMERLHALAAGWRAAMRHAANPGSS